MLDPDWRLWLLPLFGVDPSPSQEWGSPVPKPFPSGASFTDPGVFSVSYTGGAAPATLSFAWLDMTPPTRPTVKAQTGGRMISLDGGADAASGLARIELRFAGRLRSFSPGYASFNFRRGLAGPASVTAIDNAGNRSAPVTLAFTGTGPVRIGR